MGFNMSSSEIKEFRVESGENAKRIMYLAKFLMNNERIEMVSNTNSAVVAARAAENLARLNYVTYENLRTETNVVNDRRRTRLVITLRKTSQFNKLYEENEANRKKLQEAQT